VLLCTIWYDSASWLSVSFTSGKVKVLLTTLLDWCSPNKWVFLQITFRFILMFLKRVNTNWTEAVQVTMTPEKCFSTCSGDNDTRECCSFQWSWVHSFIIYHHHFNIHQLINHLIDQSINQPTNHHGRLIFVTGLHAFECQPSSTVAATNQRATAGLFGNRSPYYASFIDNAVRTH
jgi:hypothetical protein